MENIKARVKDNILILKVDLSVEGTLTKKGTSYNIAGTSFFEKIEGLEGVSFSMVILRSTKVKPLKIKPTEDEPTKTAKKKKKKFVED